MSAQLITDFWAAMGTNDFGHASTFLHAQYEYFMPQTGEYLRGRDAFAALNSGFPAEGLWQFNVVRLVAGDHDAVSDVEVTDGTRHDRAVTFHTIEDGLIRRQVEYWPDPYPAPAWRAPFVTVLDKPPF